LVAVDDIEGPEYDADGEKCVEGPPILSEARLIVRLSTDVAIEEGES
jgi:hypothetical protein